MSSRSRTQPHLAEVRGNPKSVARGHLRTREHLPVEQQLALSQTALAFLPDQRGRPQLPHLLPLAPGFPKRSPRPSSRPRRQPRRRRSSVSTLTRGTTTAAGDTILIPAEFLLTDPAPTTQRHPIAWLLHNPSTRPLWSGLRQRSAGKLRLSIRLCGSVMALPTPTSGSRRWWPVCLQ